MRQHLIDIVLVIAIAWGLFLTTTWVQSRQEAPALEQLLQIVRQRGHITLESDHSLLDKAWTQHAAGQPDKGTGILEAVRREGSHPWTIRVEP
jgi:hypothetical protein